MSGKKVVKGVARKKVVPLREQVQCLQWFLSRLEKRLYDLEERVVALEGWSIMNVGGLREAAEKQTVPKPNCLGRWWRRLVGRG